MRLKIIALFHGMFFSFLFQMTAAEIIPFPPPGSHNLLAADLFYSIVESKSAENVLFSPISIETLLTLSFVGAEGKTAEDLRHTLRLGAEDKTRIAQNFGEFLKELMHPNFAPELFIANRIYVCDKLKILSDFSRNAKENFNVLTESINFSKGKLTTDKINNFVKQDTQNKIKNVLSEDDINSQSNIVVVNGIYFKGKWKYSFNEKYTKTADFQINEREKSPVKMMHIKGTFNYVDLPELEARVLELPYNGSALTMLIVLPYKVGGLKSLEEKLKTLEFNFIPSRLAPHKVCAFIPKFQMEHEMDLEPILEQIGLSVIFSEKAEFPGIIDSPDGEHISIFKQKTLIEIDEFGSEVAAHSGAEGECSQDYASFNVDHPFIFAVRSKSAVYLAGHLTKL